MHSNHFYSLARVCTLVSAVFLFVSCDPFIDAPPERRLEMVRQSLQDKDSRALLEIARNPQRMAVLLDAHPGAGWYLGQRLLELGSNEEARSLFVQQMEGKDPDFKTLSVKGWVDAAVRTGEGRKLLARDGERLQGLVDPESPFATDVLATLEPAWLSALEESGKPGEDFARASVFLQARLDRGVAVFPLRPLGESGLDSWLLYHLARGGDSAVPGAGGEGPAGGKDAGTQDTGKQDSLVGLPGSHGVPLGMEALAAYDLAWEAKSGQLQAARGRDKEIRKYFSPGMAGYLEAKHDLIRGQAGKALTGLKSVAGQLDSMRKDFDLPLVRLAGRDALIKDVYTAARQGNERKTGIQVLGKLARWFDREEPALGSYAHELAGRLLLERKEWKAARLEFRKALAVPVHPDDRRRAAWYFIQSWLDEADEHRGQLRDVDGLLKALLQADGDSSFSDVLDEVMAALARQEKYGILASWFESGSHTLGAPLLNRLAWILAVGKEGTSGSGKGKKTAGHPYTDFLLKQHDSVYYHALASWMRGIEPRFDDFLGPPASLDKEQAAPADDPDLASDPGQGDASTAGSGNPAAAGSEENPGPRSSSGIPGSPGSSSPGNGPAVTGSLSDPAPLGSVKPVVPASRDERLAKVARGFVELGIPADSFGFVWKWRASLEDPVLFSLMHVLMDDGRYREALKLGDSLRLRKGHPKDTAWLRMLYPLALEEDMDRSLASLGVPREIWYSLIRTESGFDAAAVSSVGAQGLSQLMPDTARETGERHGVKGNSREPGINLRIGALYLDDQFRYFRSWPLALTAYNAGPGNAVNWRKESWGKQPWALAERMPFAETRNYVRRILESAMIYHWIYGGGKEMSAFVKDLIGRH